MLFENILLSIIKNKKQKTIFYSGTCFLVFFLFLRRINLFANKRISNIFF